METEFRKNKIPLEICVGFLLIAIAIQYACILLLNKGLFVYTLDDPYIHMALAENIKHWHYGVNISDFSAPSSSILWPFILTPFSESEYVPLIINVTAAIGIAVVIIRILSVSLNIENNRKMNIIVSTGTILIILATNIIGLVFTGMEHSLQVLLVLLIAYGLIIEVEKKEVKSWLLAIIIVAPSIRYECLAISIAAVAYLLVCGYFKQALLAATLTSMILMSFSAFLISIGHEPFPTSVAVKSSIVQSEGSLYSIKENVKDSFYNQRQGRVMSIGVLLLLSYVLFSKSIRKKLLANVTIIAVFLHFIAGSYDWYHRYEIYILAFTLIIIMYILGPTIKKVAEKSNVHFVSIIIIIVGVSLLIGKEYIFDLFSIPIASNNIYEQQYQMHRFAVDYYKKPVAVNDLGYVSYKNDNYVLDLNGLGSQKAYRYRTEDTNPDWLKEICEESDIGLVMIYPKWFKSESIPDEWIEIGKLRLGKKQITVNTSEVVFYATNRDAFSEIVANLSQYITTLPDGVKFVYAQSKS